MPIVRTQVTLEHDSALPEDRAVNTFHAIIDDVTVPANIAAWHTALKNFYTTLPSGSTAKVSDFLASTLSGKWSLRSYNIADLKPRVPILSEEPTDLIPGTSALPAEVAVCLSFSGAAVSGVNQARRRGRVFLGPLTSNSATIDASARPSIATNGLMRTIDAAATVLLTASDASLAWSWAVYSPTNNSAVPVVKGYVDDAFDIQRRRGVRPTNRVNFP